MPKLSPRDAVKVYQVSRATLMKALSEGTISAEKTDAGHWRIDPAELRRVYSPRASQAAVGRTKPDHVSRSEPDQKADVGHDISTRLAVAEAALDAEREKNAMLQRHLDDVRRMLPPPDDASPRRRWWPW
jgi:predicted site-specific integrase-resolvase